MEGERQARGVQGRKWGGRRALPGGEGLGGGKESWRSGAQGRRAWQRALLAIPRFPQACSVACVMRPSYQWEPRGPDTQQLIQGCGSVPAISAERRGEQRTAAGHQFCSQTSGVAGVCQQFSLRVVGDLLGSLWGISRVCHSCIWHLGCNSWVSGSLCASFCLSFPTTQTIYLCTSWRSGHPTCQSKAPRGSVPRQTSRGCPALPNAPGRSHTPSGCSHKGWPQVDRRPFRRCWKVPRLSSHRADFTASPNSPATLLSTLPTPSFLLLSLGLHQAVSRRVPVRVPLRGEGLTGLASQATTPHP